MDAAALEIAIKACVAEISRRMHEAAGIAKAAETCANTGNVSKAVEITQDLDQILYETTTLLNGASLMNRIWEA